ncbi:MAG: fibrillarin-like rRNA/tRNA 2'-O-methyltransferase [archaeon]|nr:fibrillarin-like rRNA/tRNA 2'-O-methyltransferase [archaeon]
MKQLKQLLDGVYEIQSNLATVNLTPGKKVYGEELVHAEGKEFRLWNPNRSKVGAAIKKGIKTIHLKKGSKVLYLGAAEGTTISHLSDIVEKEGTIFGVDISARSMRKFIYLCEQRPNLIPILGDANQPNTYREYLNGFTIDALFQDVSQKNQAEIFLRNARLYLKRDGHGFLSIKAKSIDSSASVEKLVMEETKKLENEFEILETIPLHPFEKDHAMIHCIKK